MAKEDREGEKLGNFRSTSLIVEVLGLPGPKSRLIYDARNSGTAPASG